MVQGPSIPSKDNNGIIAQNCGRRHREILMCVNGDERRGKTKQGGGEIPAALFFGRRLKIGNMPGGKRPAAWAC
jgi:hypothetical protein